MSGFIQGKCKHGNDQKEVDMSFYLRHEIGTFDIATRCQLQQVFLILNDRTRSRENRIIFMKNAFPAFRCLSPEELGSKLDELEQQPASPLVFDCSIGCPGTETCPCCASFLTDEEHKLNGNL